jgi:hypothetical protein
LSAEVATDGDKADQLTKKWVEFQMDEAVHQYKDYFESDKEEDYFLMEEAKQFDRETLLSMYENVIQNPGEQKVRFLYCVMKGLFHDSQIYQRCQAGFLGQLCE